VPAYRPDVGDNVGFTLFVMHSQFQCHELIHVLLFFGDETAHFFFTEPLTLKTEPWGKLVRRAYAWDNFPL
jgi:hypothetical protein